MLFNKSAPYLGFLSTSSAIALEKKNCTFADGEAGPGVIPPPYITRWGFPGDAHGIRICLPPGGGIPISKKTLYTMASKSQTMFNGVQSGRVGSIVGFKREDATAPQGIRPYVAPSNPKTRQQAKQRARFAGISLFMSFMNQIADHNIEGQKVGRWNRRAFSKLLFTETNNALISAKGAQVLALANTAGARKAVKISKGSLGKVTPVTNVSPTALGTLTEESIAEAGLQIGDIVTIVKGTIGTSNLTGVTYKQYQIAVDTEINDLGLVFANGEWTATMADACFGVIIERNGRSTHLLSTSEFAMVPKYEYETTEKCYASYMNADTTLKDDKYLYGEDFTENPKPAAGVTMRNLIINGESLSIGGTRQMLTTAALTGSVDIVNLDENQEAVAALGDYTKGESVNPGSAIGQFSHGSIAISHAAFGSAGSQQIWLMIDGVAFKKIATLTIVEPPFETNITSVSIDGKPASKNANVTVDGQTCSINAVISAYAAGHTIGIGFSTSNMVQANSANISGSLSGLTSQNQQLKLFVDGVEVETWCNVKTTYVSATTFENVKLNNSAWQNNQQSNVNVSVNIRGNVSAPGATNVYLMKKASKPVIEDTTMSSDKEVGTINSGGFTGSVTPDSVGKWWLVATHHDELDNEVVDDIFDYYLDVVNGQ